MRRPEGSGACHAAWVSTPLRLRPDARPARRAPGTVQFGLWPGPGCVVTGLTEDESDLLLSLRDVRATGQVAAIARRHGVTPERADELLALLGRQGLLARGEPDGSMLGALQGRHVCVLGQGQFPDRVREELRRCGVGRVGEAWTEGGAVDLVVLVAGGAVAPQEAPVWWARGLGHLPAVAHGGRVVVGPLVLPRHGPCLHCLDLHRRDRDGAWPRVLAQVAPTATDLAGPVTADPALASAAAAVCAMVVRDHLSARPVPPGVAWEVRLPRGEVTARQWLAHPGCPCQAATSA